MATPPFSLNTGVPGDTDTVSGFPNLDRSDKDVIQSWLRTDHNVDGTHDYVTFLEIDINNSGGSSRGAPSPTSGRTAMFRDTDKAVKFKSGDDGSVSFVHVPPGTLLPYAGTTLPTGYYWCDGSQQSRSTDSRLFAAIGTAYGIGDGSTTFNVPDLRGRIPVGKDDLGTNGNAARIGTLVTDGGTIVGTTMGSVGGSAAHVLTVAELAVHTHGNSLNENPHTHNIASSDYNGSGGMAVHSFVSAGQTTSGANNSAVSSTTTGITITNASAGSGGAHAMLQPSVIVTWIIKR